MEFFTIANGISVHVWDTRDEKAPGQTGPDACLVLLHGYLETMYIFNELIDALKPHYRIIALDLPGHGLTGSAPAGADGVRVNSLKLKNYCEQKGYPVEYYESDGGHVWRNWRVYLTVFAQKIFK